MKTLTLILLLFLISCQSQKECLFKVAAVDVGSGTTKLNISTIDSCKKEIVKEHFSQKYKVSYADSIQTDNKTFNAEVQKRGIEVFTIISKLIEEHKPKQVKAYATAAFRQASNVEAYLTKVKPIFAHEIKIISQAKEASLNFEAAVTKFKLKQDESVVWDIGGGSMQVTGIIKNKIHNLYLGTLASLRFKNHIIKNVQNKDIKKVFSPNPISVGDADKASRKIASLKDPLKSVMGVYGQIKNINIIGIGGVHNYSILNQLKKYGIVSSEKDSYSLDEVVKLRAKMIGKRDQDLDSGYAETEVSNIILVESFMKVFNFHKVMVRPVNLTDAIFTDLMSSTR